MPEDRTAQSDNTEKTAANNGSSRWISIVGTIASLGILAFSVYVVAQVLATLNYAQVLTAIRATSYGQIAMAIAFGAGSYLALTFYDAIALRHLREMLPYRTAALASFSAYTMSFTLGFPLLTGGATRYAIYSRAGVSAGNIARLVMICSLQFWLGMNVVVGVGLVLHPEHIAAIDQLAVWINVAIGYAVLAAVVAYCIYVGIGPRTFSIRGVSLTLPGFKLTLAQIIASCCDLACASSVLYVLLPQNHGVDFLSFAAIYVVAVTVGAASNVPGGIGPFEATFLKALPGVSAEALLASLLLFRVIYFLGPFLLGLVLIGGHETHVRLRGISGKSSGPDTPSR
ncbi:YbhN family protein [Roseiarcaceae bacterium H3SJ34-1]|uniref:lysylphosphatidylglycerol synthase transmembrane domain-containing protein n=1 Tax=Terripilifer ovatus TaxID=3032367 RepID=UPI003AB9398B|nr:YbhN family protein [Roseiarcaceae bacterium H3SJ34-1]